MGANDTSKIGFRRPAAGAVTWGDGEVEDLNHNFTILDQVMLPGGVGGAFQLRVVAQSLVGISVPASAKVFGTIQDAIDDSPINTPYMSPIAVYPGVYNEALVIIDRSVHIYGITPFHGGSHASDGVRLSSNEDPNTASGRPCVTVKLRTGRDDNDAVVDRTISEMWALPNHQHDSRYSTKIMFSNFFMQNHGKFYLDEAHDEDTCYYLDCTDRGIPPYYQQYSWLIFNNCAFRGQTWKNRTASGHAVGWYQKGFNIRAFGVWARFMNCLFMCGSYAGGSYGQEYFPGIRQPFKVGTDGTSFVSWYMGPPGGTYETTRFDGDINGPQAGYTNNRSYIRWMSSDFVATDPSGSIGSWAPPGYDGNGWWYGHDSDSSCALITLFNMGQFHLRGGTFYPSAWGLATGFGPDPNDDDLTLSNWRHLYTDPTDPASVTAEDLGEGSDSPECGSTGLTLDGVSLVGSQLLNSYGCIVGGFAVRDPG